MESPRCAGPTLLTSLPSMRIWPDEMSSNPAMSLSSVDLPQPEGPTKTVNSPSSTFRSTPLMTAMPPKALRTCLSSMLPIVASFDWSKLLDGAEGEAAHELALREPSQNQDWRDRQHRSRREQRPEIALGTRKRGDHIGQRRRIDVGKVERPEGLVPGENDGQQHRGSDAGNRHRRQHINDLVGERCAIHSR